MEKISTLTDPNDVMDRIEGYARNACKSHYDGGNPHMTLGFLKSLIRRYEELTK